MGSAPPAIAPSPAARRSTPSRAAKASWEAPRRCFVPAKVAGAGRYSERLLAAIDHALEFAESDRPQTLAEWKSELAATSAAKAAAAPKPKAAATRPACPCRAPRAAHLGRQRCGGRNRRRRGYSVDRVAVARSATSSCGAGAEALAPEKPPNGELNGPLSDRLAALEQQLAQERKLRDEERQRRLEEERQRRAEEERLRRMEEDRQRRAKQESKPAVTGRTVKPEPHAAAGNRKRRARSAHRACEAGAIEDRALEG